MSPQHNATLPELGMKSATNQSTHNLTINVPNEIMHKSKNKENEGNINELKETRKSPAAGDIQSVMLATNDQVHGLWDASVKFGTWSDLLMVMKVKDIEKIDEMQKRLQETCVNAPPMFTNSNIDVKGIRGSLVACKFSNDGQYYRAIVTGTKPDKVRLCFVDFGNIEGKYLIFILMIEDVGKIIFLVRAPVNNYHEIIFL